MYKRQVDMSEEERQEMARKVGLGALKYFLLKVEPVSYTHLDVYKRQSI